MRSINHEDGETGRNEGIRKVFLFIQFADDTASWRPCSLSLSLSLSLCPVVFAAETFKAVIDKLGSWEAKEAQMQKQIRASRGAPLEERVCMQRYSPSSAI